MIAVCLFVQLQHAIDDETRDKVEIVAILSMTEKEVDDALEMVSKVKGLQEQTQNYQEIYPTKA